MKMKSKLISLVLALTLVIGSIGTIGFATTYSDVDNTKSYFASISLLSALELLKGYDGGTFRPDGDITRAEFATVVVRALGQEESAKSAAGQTKFDDVASDSWASGYINIASTLGIINGFGDGNFGPDQKVTYEQAVKMMVCALGYEALAFDIVGNNADAVWPNGYLTAANQLSIVTGVAGVQGVDAKRWQVARLVYNSLEVNLMEKTMLQGEERFVVRTGKTLLGNNLNVKLSNGNFRADASSSVAESGARARAGEVTIYDSILGEEETFKDGDLNTTGLVGRAVKFYYTETIDGIKTLVYIEDRTANSEVVLIDASDIDLVTGTNANGFEFRYWQDQSVDTRPQTLSTEKGATVMYNGGVLSNPELKHVWPVSGSVELIDSDRSGKFDKILVTSYETYFVKGINTSDKKITDNYRVAGEDHVLEINEDDSQLTVSIKRVDGTKITFSNISQWNVLSVKQSLSTGRNTLDVIVSNKVVNGSISAIEDENTIEVDGKQYKISNYFNTYAKRDSANSYKVGDSGKFYLDKDDKIAGYERTASASSNYGYLVGVDSSSSRLKVTIRKNNNSTTVSTGTNTYNAASRLRLDGDVKQNNSEASEYLRNIVDDTNNINVDVANKANIPSNYTPQLIRYSQNSSNEVTSIETIKSNDLTADNKNGYLTYSSNNNGFSGNGGSFTITSSTMIFIVPSDRSASEKYSSRMHTPSDSIFKNGRSYYVEAYDVAGSVAKAIVVYDTGVAIIDETSPLAIVKNVASFSNTNDSEYNKRITAFVFGSGLSSGSELQLITKSNSDTDSLNVGDVFRYEKSIQGNVELIEVVSRVGGSIEYVHKQQPTAVNPSFELYNGLLDTLENTEGNIYRLTIPKRDDMIEDFTFTTNNNTKVFLYNASVASNLRLEAKNISFIGELNNYAATNDKADEVIIYTLKNGNDITQSLVYVIRR